MKTLQMSVFLFGAVLFASPYARAQAAQSLNNGGAISVNSVSEDGFDPNQRPTVRQSAETKAGLMAAILRSESESESEFFEARASHQDDRSDTDPTTPRTRAVVIHSGTRARSEQAADDIERAFGKSSPAPFVLRCWQEGRLILQRDIKSLPKLARASVDLEDAQGVSLQLFDLQNATCMMQRRN
jgi:hypothetical protein